MDQHVRARLAQPVFAVVAIGHTNGNGARVTSHFHIKTSIADHYRIMGFGGRFGVG